MKTNYKNIQTDIQVPTPATLSVLFHRLSILYFKYQDSISFSHNDSIINQLASIQIMDCLHSTKLVASLYLSHSQMSVKIVVDVVCLLLRSTCPLK